MQLSVITDEISQDFEHALDVMGEYGVTGVELRGLWGTNIADLTAEQALRAQAAVKSREMQVVCLATPFFKCDLDPQGSPQDESAGPMHLAPLRDLDQQVQILERSIRLAHQFEVRLLRVFSFWRKAALTPTIEAQILDRFAAPLALAERESITLVLENEHACFIGSGEETARLMAQIRSPHLRVCWDPGNAYSQGETPFPDGYQAVRPWVAHVHLKDAHRVETEHGPQARFVEIGQGEIDYPGQFQALRNDGYKGWLSLETHFAPQGGTPEDSSRACLRYLSKALRTEH